MKQKKKIVRSVFAVLASACCVTTFAACGGCNKGHQHTWNDATCTEPKTCSECGATEGEAMGHNYGTNGIQEVAATCTEDGFKYGECIVCHSVVREQYPALGHVYETSTEPVTCTTDGVTTYTCKNCTDDYSEITTRSTGHNLDGAEWRITSEQLKAQSECMYDVVESATCKTEGCGEVVNRSYTVHKGKYTAAVQPATCQAKGSITYTCACGNENYTYTVETAVNANAHHWVPATSGNATHVCDVANCGATQTKVEKEGTSAQISAAELASENVAIAMNNTVMQPDKALLEKIGTADVELTAETVAPGSITMDEATQEKVKESGAEIYNFDLKKDGQSVNFDGGKMTISIPYELAEGEDPNSISILYIAGDGTAKEYEAVYTDGCAVFEAEHFSFYTVVRVSPAERCAKVGHDYKDTVVEATCTQAGYTIKNCRRCGDYKTVDPVKAKGHDYNETVVAPTCTERGYTLYECKNCSDSYVSKWVKETAHTYTDKVVAPTCTENGYTEHTCSGCGKTYKDNYVTSTGHTYVNGTCSVCNGKENAKNANNIYFNLLDSIASMRSYYVNVNDVHIEFSEKMPGSDAAETRNIAMDFYRMSLSMDDNGNITGKGEGRITMTANKANTDGSVSKVVEVSEMKMVLQDGKSYTYTKDTTTTDGNVTRLDEYYDLSMQDSPEANAEMMAAITAIYNENVQPLVESVKTLADSPLNEVMAKAVEYVFDKEQTDNGYTFTLNYNHLKDIYTSLTTDSFKTVFEKAFGAGSFDSVVTWVNALPNKTVGTVVDEALSVLSSIGVEKEQLYSAINNVIKEIMNKIPSAPAEGPATPMPNITVETLLETYKDFKISQVIVAVAPGMSEVEIVTIWKQTVDQVVAVLSDENTPFLDTVYNLVSSLGGNAGGTDKQEPDFAEKPMLAAYAEEAAVSLTQMLKAYDAQVNAAVAAANSGAIISFTTDANGKLLSVDQQLKDFDLSMNIPYEGDSRPGEEPAEPAEPAYAEIHIKANGTATVTPGGDFAGNVGTIVKALDNAVSVFTNVAEGTKVASKVQPFVFKKVEGVMMLLPDISVDDITIRSRYEIVINGNRYSINNTEKDQTYNGEACDKLTVGKDIRTYILLPERGISFSKDCGSWNAYHMQGIDSYSEMYLYVVGKKILGYEFDTQYLLESYKEMQNESGNRYYSSQTIYYNTATKQFAKESQHNYVVVDVKEGKCDVYTTIKLRCASCGKNRTEYQWVGHNTVRSYEFKDSAAKCAGGIIAKDTCKDCNKVVWQNEYEGVSKDGRHYTIRTETPLESTCGNLKLVENKCLCGEYVERVNVNGKCEFSRSGALSTYCSKGENGLCEHGYREHRKDVFVCAVTNCQYTYTVERYYKPTGEKCQFTYHEEYTLADSSVHKVTPHQTKIHDYRWVESTEGELQVEKETCSVCENVREIMKYQILTADGGSYREQVYQYYKYEDGDGYGWKREYRDPCHYTEYRLGDNEQVEGTGVEGVYHQSFASDEQKQGDTLIVTEFCPVCKEQSAVEKYQIFTDNDGATYSRQFYRFNVIEKNGWEKVFDGCNYVTYVLDENGVKTSQSAGTGIDHVEYSKQTVGKTCTQFGEYEAGCLACNMKEHFYTQAYGHNYYYDGDKGTYVCKMCGLENETSVRGPIDLEEKIDGDTIEIGYNVKYRRDTVAVEVYLNMGLENNVLLEVKVDVNEKVTTALETMSEQDIYEKYGIWPLGEGLRCGKLTVSKTAILQAVDEHMAEHPDYDLQYVSIAMVAEGRTWGEDEYPDFINNAINYTIEELAA